ncbi:MAG: glycogen-binding domain-containing protein [Verrucomicrobia bacterium]|nr:glycogen-binding domain-containing protein [Verrucomicrobiota bacterium]
MARKTTKKSDKALATEGPANGKAFQSGQQAGVRTAVAADRTTAPAAPKPVKATFVLLDLGAKQVFLAGEFNGWASNGIPMKRDDAGHWEATITLAPGRYEYKFVVDGEWVPDPLARDHVRNQHGTLNSVIEVRA